MKASEAETLEELFARVLGQPLAAMDDSTSPVTHPMWDSVRHIELITALESAYGVQLSHSDVMCLASLASADEILRAHGLTPPRSTAAR